MNQLLIDFSAIITNHSFKMETSPGPKFIERYEFILIDGSRLVTYESRKGTKFKYSYQWMTEANRTIYRWDNTPHFSEFDTFPCHRHVGPDEIAEPFPFVSLANVFIINRIDGPQLTSG
jgi:hypothetical protein